MSQLLKTFIKETVKEIIQEVTARTGPRTGGFEFDPDTIEKIFQRAIKAKRELEKKAGDKEEKIALDKKARFQVRNPITGKNTYVLVEFFRDPRKGADSGTWDPARKQIGLNTFHLIEDKQNLNLWFKGTIAHELTHFFNDMYHFQDGVEASKKSIEKYLRAPYEKSAFTGGTLVRAMLLSSNNIADKIKSGDVIAKKLGENLVKKPYRLYERLRNEDPAFAVVINTYMKDPQSILMKKLNKAAYDIVQRTIVPALYLSEI